jgi:hypothetical protein
MRKKHDISNMKLTITIAVYHYLKSQGKARICNQSTNTRKKKKEL